MDPAIGIDICGCGRQQVRRAGAACGWRKQQQTTQRASALFRNARGYGYRPNASNDSPYPKYHTLWSLSCAIVRWSRRKPSLC